MNPEETETEATELAFEQGRGFFEIKMPAQLAAELETGGDFREGFAKVGFTPRSGQWPTWYSDELAMTEFVVFERKEPLEGWRFIVSVWDVHGGEFIFVKTRACLMALTVQVLPLVQNMGRDFHLEEVHQAAERAFQAWHGHAYDSPCSQCDPDAIARRERERARLRREAEAQAVQEQKGTS